MHRFEVRLLRRQIETVVESAEQAYHWLDKHAVTHDPYVINAIAVDGGVTIIDHGTWWTRSRKESGSR